MADIDIVKKGSSTWLWVVIAVVILLAALFFLMRGNSAPGTGALRNDEGRPLAAALVLCTDGAASA